MGVYCEKFRQLISKLPKSPEQFTDPYQASSCMAHLTNSVLQIVQSLEEALEDSERQREALEDMLMEKTPTAGVPKFPSRGE
jgi:hypothetical protein